jgi:hypothetical protein
MVIETPITIRKIVNIFTAVSWLNLDKIKYNKHQDFKNLFYTKKKGVDLKEFLPLTIIMIKNDS